MRVKDGWNKVVEFCHLIVGFRLCFDKHGGSGIRSTQPTQETMDTKFCG